MTTLLQVNFTNIDKLNLEISVLLFAITIPYLLLDVYFLIIEPKDGKSEQIIFSILRVVFWIVGGIGIGFSFNILENYSGYQTIYIFWLSLITFFILRWFGLAAREKIEEEK